jgi:tyrosinase
LSEPQVLANASAARPVKVNVATDVAVEIPNLLSAMGDTRIFRAPEAFGFPRNAIEPSRLVAKIEGLVPPKNPDIAVGVFVNSPYLTPDTPSYDPTCAGVITFFGAHGAHAQAGNIKRTDYIDLSNALRALGSQGLIASNKITVQLMPVTLTEGTKTDVSLGQPSVTILST